MKVFITGGSGFVGQNLIPLLISKGYSVNALARSNKAADTLKQLGANVINGDLDNLPALKEGIAGCQSVFHLAASVDFWATSEQLWGLHVVAVQNLLQEAKGAGVKNFVYLSAASVIITGKPMSNADETFVSNNLLDGYSQTKLEAEKMVLRANAPGFKTISIRPPLIWGKGDHHVLPSIIETIEKKKMQLIDGGLMRIATCHVRNVCEGLIDGEKAEKGGEAYFITDGDPVVMKDFIGKYVATQGVTLPDKKVSLGMARTVAGVMEFVWNTFRLKGQPPLFKAMVNMLGVELTINDNKARRDIGYKNVVTVEQGLCEMK